MTTRSLHFSSKNGAKGGLRKAHDFTSEFNRSLKLENDMRHEFAVRRILMTYAWHSIMPE